MVTTPMSDEMMTGLPEASPMDQPVDDQAQEIGLGEWNERLEPELQQALLKLAEKFCDEFKYPRRLEVMKAWQARSFWREMQHLNWNWDAEAWDVLGPAGYRSGSNPTSNDSSVLYSTNMYQGFGESFIAIITQAVPNLRFEPEDSDDAADIETARASESLRKLVQHENDPVKLMTKAAYLAWTDGRMHGWTRWAMDKRTKQYREMQTIFGVMEVKVPVIYEEDCEYPYLQLSGEIHLSTAHAKVKGREFEPDYYKKIKGGASGTGQGVYERTARISIKQGISMKSAGGDAYSSLVTEQCTWMRPECFMDDSVDEKYRDQLEQLFSSGCWLETMNGVYTGSKDSCQDDQWVVENIMEGDGSFRNAKGTCLTSVQERANDIINLTQDTFEKTVPAKHMNQKMFDVEALNQQTSMPGAAYGVNMEEAVPAGASLESQISFEPPAHVSAEMLTYLKELMTDIPEFLTGISAILFGSDSSGDKSGKALQIQQNAAMGRIGLPFRVLKRLYARMMEQAVRCAVLNRDKDVNLSVPGDDGKTETLLVAVAGLSGKIRCFPDSDENFPESWISKRNTYMQLLQEGNNDPVMHAILTNPKNQMFAKKMIGLTELEIPDADSWDKQMVEINLMLTEPFDPGGPIPVPNPLTGDMEVITKPPASSIPIDPDYDNHEAEFLTVTIWINGPKGQKAKKENEAGFMNVRLHGLAHKQQIMMAMAQQAAQAAAANGPKQPPPDEPSHKDSGKVAEQKPEQGQQGPPAI